MPTATSRRDERIEVVAEHETLPLTPRDWEAFLVALDDTDRPRPRLAGPRANAPGICRNLPGHRCNAPGI